jgi:Protein of unknown function (DUF4199)
VNPVLSAGLLIGVGCAIWTFVMGATGWYKDPAMARLFYVVILFEIAGLWWGLRRTAAEGRGYGSQIIAGTMMSIVAGVVVILSSLLFTTVIYTDYLSGLESLDRQQLAQQGKSAAEIDVEIGKTLQFYTPMNYAIGGFMGTLITGIIASSIIGFWVRSRFPRSGPALSR